LRHKENIRIRARGNWLALLGSHRPAPISQRVALPEILQPMYCRRQYADERGL
jgi:hypothetical protein